MIISELCGGLGNQMFQYAFSRAISLKLGEKLKVVYTTLPGQTIHNGFELPRVFSMDIDLATFSEIRKSLNLFYTSALFRKIISNEKYYLLKHNSFITERDFELLCKSEKLHSGLFFSGYWQSEKYFLEFQDVIRKDFTFTYCNDAKTLGYLEKIKKGQSLSIHIRRGDYITNSKAANTHGVCSVEYYKKAYYMMRERFPDINVFIFSDDIDWVLSTFKPIIPNMTVVENTGINSFKDMFLMSNCQHHIIANSSFSWWGAWLNPSLDKIIISPKNWFLSVDKNENDLIPSNWLKV